MRTLVVADQFIPARPYLDAFARLAGEGEVHLRTVDWHGTKADQHGLQHLMEVSGPNAVDPPPELLGALDGIEAVCIHFAPFGQAVIDAAPALKVISIARAGLENVDLEAATRRGIAVVPALGRNAGAVAELQIGLMLAEARNIARADQSIKSGGWRKEFPGARIEIAASTVGMVGFGHVGRTFAQRLSGFGARLIAYDPYTDSEEAAELGVRLVGTIEEIFVESDFVLIQARLSAETERLVGRELLDLMKPTAYFMNVSRSRLVDTEALFDALDQGRISGAGLDVFDTEPLPPDSRWRKLDNVTLTTHFGGDTESTNETSAALVAEGVLEFQRTGRVRRAVNATELGWQ